MSWVNFKELDFIKKTSWKLFFFFVTQMRRAIDSIYEKS